MKKLTLLCFSIFAITLSTKAQDGFEGYLLASNNDRSKLVEAYINPVMKGLIHDMNSGWYHTAKVHKTLGFDVSIALNTSFIPSEDEMFTLTGLNSINTGSISAATVGGSEDVTPLTTVSFAEGANTYTASFNAPGGVKESLPLNAIPAGAIQLNLGLPAEFEIGVKFLPKVGSEDVKGSLYGMSLKKEITNWFGPLDKLPLHVALMGAFTNMSVDYEIENSGAVEIQNGLAEFRLNSYTFQALASLNFPIINLYGGLGYGAGSSTLRMLGDYTLNYSGNLSRTISDPIDTEFNAGSFRSTLGTRLSLGFFKLFADYTFQEYNTLNFGIAISIR